MVVNCLKLLGVTGNDVLNEKDSIAQACQTSKWNYQHILIENRATGHIAKLWAFVEARQSVVCHSMLRHKVDVKLSHLYAKQHSIYSLLGR